MKLDNSKVKLYSQIGTRATFGLACIELLKKYENLMVCTADVSTSAGLDRFRKKYPNNLKRSFFISKISKGLISL